VARGQPIPIEDQHGAERRAAGYADDAGFGQRIAQEALHDGTREPQREAYQQAQERPRQPEFDEDKRTDRPVPAQCIAARTEKIQRRISDGERRQE